MKGAVAHHWRVAAQSARLGIDDYRALYTWKSWLFGWFLLVVAQVLFWTMFGRLIDSPTQLRFLLVGNAALVAGTSPMLAVAVSTWERRGGTFGMLVISPSNPVVVFLARSVHWIVDGAVAGYAVLVLATVVFAIPTNPGRVLAAAPVMLAVAFGAYAVAMALAAVVQRAASLRNLLSSLALGVMSVLCGVNVPVTVLSPGLRTLAQALPLTHGVAALRGVLDHGWDSAATGSILRCFAVGCGWLAASALCYLWAVRRDRADGSATSY